MSANKPPRRRQTTKVIKKRRSSRRYDTSIGIGRLRVDSATVRGSGWISVKLISLLAIGLIIGIFYVLLSFDNFYIYKAQVSGTTLYSSEEIYDATGTKGLNVFWVKPKAVAQNIVDNLPYVIKAQVRVSLPDRLSIDVVERQPKFLWETASGVAWVDEKGLALPPHGEKSLLSVVKLVDLQHMALGVVSQNEPERIGSGGIPVVEMDRNILDALTTLQNSFLAVKTYYLDPQNGLNFYTPDGINVILGNTGDWQHKVDLLKAIQSKLQKRPGQIDLRVAERPVVR